MGPDQSSVPIRLHEDGRIEIGLEHDGERHLPRARLVPRSALSGRWLRSSPVTIAVDAPQPEPVPVEPPADVRPSDHEEFGWACLEEADTDGNAWTRTGEAEAVGSFDAAAAVHRYVLFREWAAERTPEDHPAGEQREAEEEFKRDEEQAAAWFAQCASYHGLDVTPGQEPAANPDDWMH